MTNKDTKKDEAVGLNDNERLMKLYNSQDATQHGITDVLPGQLPNKRQRLDVYVQRDAEGMYEVVPG